ncbi:uncharacterized protein LOC143275903 [Babylonia areolata]|uniref:uncharacterized protein LOC143275903 n=1 Tax=Babylonia areolata TaxID=304850 RepID=UPI003FD2C394
MATGGQPRAPQPTGPVTSLTDCPQCGSLCLGAVILPCGHVSCRKCLHKALHLLGPKAGCRQCGKQLDVPRDQALTFSQLVERFGLDPVVGQLVYRELEKETDIRCHNCSNNNATHVCWDCREYYCDFCTSLHRKMEATEDHVLHMLPQAMHNAPSGSRSSPRPRPSSLLSTASLESIRNDGDSQSAAAPHGKSRGVKEWKAWVKKEVPLLKQASDEQQKVSTTLQDVMTLGQQLLNRVQAQQHVLDNYQHQLPRFSVSQSSDPNSSTVMLTSPDVTVDVRTEPLERRVRDVRQCHHCPKLNEVKAIRSQLSRLLHSADQQTSPDATSTTTGTSSTPSPIPTPTAADLPPPYVSSTTPTSTALSPPTHPATPTFTPPVDVMTTAPQCVFQTSPTTADDERKPCITAVVCLPDNRLVMADYNNSKVKVMGVAPPDTVSPCLTVGERPWALAVLSDGLVAMTTCEPVIYLMAVTDTVTVRSRVQTVRWYEGIAGHSDGHLVVGCEESGKEPAAVHVLNRQGHVVRTLTDSTRLTGLRSPLYLFDSGDHVLVSDGGTDLVHQVSVRSGQVTHTFQHEHVRRPRQVCTDSDNNVYVASCFGKCVCVRSRGGEWRQLVTPSLHRPSWCVFPRCLCLTSSGHLVVGWWGGVVVGDCVVVGYKLS